MTEPPARAPLTPPPLPAHYELGLQNACTCHFPAARKQGCWFHFNKATLRQAYSMGLQEGKNLIRKTVNLAFLPDDDVEAGWTLVNACYPQELIRQALQQPAPRRKKRYTDMERHLRAVMDQFRHVTVYRYLDLCNVAY